MVEVNAVARRGVLCKLFNSVEAKLNGLGCVYVYAICNGVIILIGDSDLVGTRLGHINLGGIEGHLIKRKRLKLAVFKLRVKTNAACTKGVAYEEVNVAGSDELKAALLGNLNYTVKLEIEDILGTAVLTACNRPLALGYLNGKKNKRAGACITHKLNIGNGSVGSDNLGPLHISAAGAVLDNEGKSAGTGNVDLYLMSIAADLNGLIVLSALVGLGSVSDLGAGNDSKHTVNIVGRTGSCIDIAYVKGVGNLLKEYLTAKVALVALVVAVSALGKNLGTSVTCVIGILVSTLCDFLTAEVTVVVGVLVSALGNDEATVVAKVVVVILMLGENIHAYVTKMVLVIIYAGRHRLATNVTVVIVGINASGYGSAALITFVILVFVSVIAYWGFCCFKRLVTEITDKV